MNALDGASRSYPATWHVVVDPSGPADGDTGDEVRLWFAGARIHYPAGRTTDVGSTERAARTWVEPGERASPLTWWPRTVRIRWSARSRYAGPAPDPVARASTPAPPSHQDPPRPEGEQQ